MISRHYLQQTTGIATQLKISISTAFVMPTGTTTGYFTIRVSISCTLPTITSCAFYAKPYILLSGLPRTTQGISARLQQGTCRRWLAARRDKVDFRKTCIWCPKTGSRAEVFEEPTGWQKVDRQLQEVRLRLDTADSEEQYQAVGLLCREVLISVAQEVYKPDRHRATDGVSPSDTDAKRMLDAIFEIELKGSSNEEARAHAKAAVRLALALQHKRTADFRTAALCAEGTLSVVNMLAVLAGRRGRSFE
jgi:hypothetical protein